MVELTQFHDLAVRRNVLQKAVSRSVIFQFAPIPHLHLGHFSLAGQRLQSRLLLQDGRLAEMRPLGQAFANYLREAHNPLCVLPAMGVKLVKIDHMKCLTAGENLI